MASTWILVSGEYLYSSVRGCLEYIESDRTDKKVLSRSPTYSSGGRNGDKGYNNMPLGMSNSFSAPDFQSRTHLLESHYSMNTGAPSPARVRFSLEENDSPERSPRTPQRHDRPLLRAGSPTKMTFDEIVEEIAKEQRATGSPVKRSRSPVKQLFGEGGFLGRSLSYKEAPEDRYRKKGVKHGIEKIRQRMWNKVGDLQRIETLKEKKLTIQRRKILPDFSHLHSPAATHHPKIKMPNANQPSTFPSTPKNNAASTRKWNS